ncbi:hypothetical protein DEJ45_06395 [Streptomyces venezuelae]|uniref:hypothetical protein n=1 Tax=Streptomyces venezuelae TaxID=54571 RepID=UPI00123D66C6|nr:hypothetical protein [Streptomyces venezuelae]QES12058.1 hypothetical protein DEJ45_06395 [Streptomyces venezuelae]
MRGYHCQVVGFGAAALGVPLAADRAGRLGWLSDAGLCFLDAAPDRARLLDSRFPYAIHSNSRAGDFLEGVRPDGALGPALRMPAGRELSRSAEQPVPLRLVGRFLNDVSTVLEQEVLPDPAVLLGARVAELRHDEDGGWTSLGADGRELATSATVVLATGAWEDTARTARDLDVDPERVVGSAELLTGSLDRAAGVLRGGGRIVVIGASHSGFATVELLLEKLGHRVTAGAITVVHRSLALSYDSMTRARAEGSLPGQTLTVCPDSGRVNRFSGLRGRSRQMCQRVVRGLEPRVRLCAAGSPEARRATADSALLVHASGYRTAEVPLRTAAGEPIPVRVRRGTTVVDDGCRVLSRHGGPVPGVFALGLGYPRTGDDGVGRVGINLFHGTDADRVVMGLTSARNNERAPSWQGR